MKRLAFALALVMFSQASRAQEKKAGPRGITVDTTRRAVIVDAKVCAAQAAEPRQGLPDRARRRLGAPAGKKAHEIVVSIDVQPSEVHKALEQLGLKPGKSALGGPPREGAPFPKADGPIVNVYLEVPDAAGGMKKVAIEKVLIDPATKKGPPKMTFIFTGSAMTAPTRTNPWRRNTARI